MKFLKKIKQLTAIGTLCIVNGASATDIDLNRELLADTAIRVIVRQVLGPSSDIKIGGGGIVVNTTGAVMNGRVERCWNAPIYDADGNVTFTLQCQ